MGCTIAARPRTGRPTSCRSRSSARSCGIKKEHPVLGRAEDPRQAHPRVPDDSAAGGEHDPRRARSQRTGQAPKRRRYKAGGTPLSAAHAPNGLWCADYKGEFLLGNRQYCYPLTITDYRSRYLLACEGLESTKSKFAFSVFERAFKDFGLPAAIRTDNGTPFAAAVGHVRLVPPLRLVAALGHPPAAHQARQPAAERPSRAHAPHAQERSHQARRVQLPAAAGALRGLHPGLQPRAAAPGTRRRLSGRALYTFSAPLRAATGSRIPVSRPHRPRDALRPHLPRQSQDQPECRRWPSSWWASAKSTTRSGRSASWSTIWDTSIEIRTGWSPVPIPSPRTQC